MAELVAALDTFYVYIAGRLQILNPSRQMGGMAQARGWPLAAPVSGALYLLVVRTAEISGGPTPSSQANRLQTYLCQWVWVLVGTDLTQAQEGENRGDVYREDMRIREELRQAHYPGFCPKVSYALVNNVPTPTTVSGETIWWSPLTGAPRLDEAPGLVFGSESVTIYSYSDVNSAVA